MKLATGLGLSNMRRAPGGPDTTAPTATSITLGTQQSAGDVPITIASLDENSTAAWVLTSSDQSGAANTAVKTAAEGGTALTGQVDFGTFSATIGGGPYNEAITSGLDGNYYFQVVFFDAAGNISPVYADGPSAIDTTAMTLSGASTTVGDTNIGVDWSTNEGQGTARIVAVPNGATAPTIAENLAGQKSGGTAADADSGNIVVSVSGAQTTVTLTGLTNGTAYDVYIAHDDGFGNTDQTSVLNTTPVAASSINRVEFDAAGSDLAVLSSVAASGAGYTVVIRAANMTSPADFALFVTGQAESQYLIQAVSDGTFKFRPRNSAGSILLTISTGTSTISNLVNIAFAVDGTGNIYRVWVNGSEVSTAALGASGNVQFPGNIGSTSFAARMDVVCFAVYEAYLDPTTHWSTWFDGAGVPQTTLLDGSAVGGVTPAEHQSGDAASWNTAYGITLTDSAL